MKPIGGSAPLWHAKAHRKRLPRAKKRSGRRSQSAGKNDPVQAMSVPPTGIQLIQPEL